MLSCHDCPHRTRLMEKSMTPDRPSAVSSETRNSDGPTPGNVTSTGMAPITVREALDWYPWASANRPDVGVVLAFKRSAMYRGALTSAADVSALNAVPGTRLRSEGTFRAVGRSRISSADVLRTRGRNTA